MGLPGPDGREWELLTTVAQRWEAEMLQGFLEANGIDTWLLSYDGSAAAYPGIGSRGQQLLVPPEQLEEARALVESGAAVTDDPQERLVGLLLDLLAIPSETGHEQAIADWLERRLRDAGELVQRVGRSLVAGTVAGDRPTVLLVGHLDVVPATAADRDPRRDDDRIVGRGASDMKSGLAVALDCFEDVDLRAAAYDVLLVAYAGEEGPHETNELGDVLTAVPELAGADLAVVLEPTDLAVQLGCLGTVHAEVTFHGRAAHSARPWLGANALHAAGPLLAELAGREPVDVEVDGLVYREVLSATQARTANARNVVPDTFTLNLNYRFAPDKSVAEAEGVLTELVARHAAVLGGAAGDDHPAVDHLLTDRAPAALPHADEPLVRLFIDAIGGAVEPKQAWTDVARLAAAGVPALNYGPGLAAQAHQRGEHVPIANLVAARDALAAFLVQAPGP